MKMLPKHYEILKNAIERVADYYGPKYVCNLSNLIPPDRLERIGDHDKALRWKLYHVAIDNLQYDDDHPFFQNGRWDRIIPYIGPFQKELYNYLNDAHIDTALRQIQKQLGLQAEHETTGV